MSSQQQQSNAITDTTAAKVGSKAVSNGVKFLLAKKEGMTRIYTEDGRVVVGTVLKTEPVVVTQVKTEDGKDGYRALQIGFGTRKTKNVSKAVLGHTKGKAYKVIREFKNAEGAVGDEISPDTFAVGDTVRVSGVTKGKGFAGVVKRHGFKGGRRTHGQKHSEREGGSIGGGGRAGGRVIKGMKMPGRMGGTRVTVKNLKVLAVYPKEGEIIVSGAVPGARGTVLEVVSLAGQAI
jgi:large subunit ribosomal protein L3